MKKIYIVPHFHYDAAWLKTREEYLQICHRHILEVLRLFRKHPRYCFLIEQAYLIKTFLERYPEQEPYFRECVKKGRIELTGMYVCPDVNIPSGEAFIRQVKMGKDYFRRTFGVDVATGYMVDIFGQHPQMPQLMAKAGINSYIFGRGMTGERVSEFFWKGIDGSSVLAIWLPLTATNLWPVPGNYPEFSRLVKNVTEELGKISPTGLILLMSGYDSSPPSPDLPVFVEQWREKGYKPCFILLKDYVALLKRRKNKLPVRTADFNPAFQGCYSSRISVKLKNRELENALSLCESAAAMNVMAGNVSPLHASIEEAWEKIVFNQFHDIICGSHTDEVFAEAQDDYRCAETLIGEKKSQEVEKLLGSINTDGEGIPVVVINALAWERTDVAEVVVSFHQGNVWKIGVFDDNMRPVPHQESELKRFENGSLKLLRITFIAESMPAFGHRVYRILPNVDSTEKGFIGERLKFQEKRWSRGLYDGLGLVELGRVENEYFSFTFDIKKGVFASLKNSRGKELIDQAIPLANVITREIDEGDLWQYHELSEGGETTSLNRVFPFPEPWEADFSHLHQMPSMAKCDMKPGPVFAEIVSGRQFGTGYIGVQVRAFVRIPRIEITTKIVNNEEGVRYRIHFPTSIRKGKIFREIPFGAVEQEEGEFPCQNWMDYSDRTKGLAILNKGIVGQGVINGIVALSILRSVHMPEEIEGNFESALEKGVEHCFNYALYPHGADWRKEHLPRRGLEFNCPLLVYKTTCHKGRLNKEYSFLKIEPSNIIASAIKRDEKENGIILRVYEAEGKSSEVKLTTGKIMEIIKTTDLLEERDETVGSNTDCFSFPLKAFEIKTLLLKFKNDA